MPSRPVCGNSCLGGNSNFTAAVKIMSQPVLSGNPSRSKGSVSAISLMRRGRHLGIAFLASFQLTGQAADPAGLSSKPLAEAPVTESKTLFQTLTTNQTGIDFVYRWNQDPKYERLFNSSEVGGGVCVGDFDGDGRPDICLTRPAGGCQLYRNLGGFHFTNVTAQAGLKTENVWVTGPTFVDINNDGLLDLYLCCYASPNQLYLNQGNGTFKECAQEYKLAYNGASMMMAFGDFDRDGWLDGYLLTAGLMPKADQQFRVKFEGKKPVVPEELQEFWQIFYLPGERAAAAEAAQFDHLFRNNGNGTFTETTRTAGLQGCDFGNSAVWWDYNGDGWPDLYVANDYFGPDRLYLNNQNGTFTDVARFCLPHTPWTSMGSDIGDLNRDGKLDLIASDMAGTTRRKRMIDMGDMAKNAWFLEYPEPRQYMRNALFINTGKESFLETAFISGLAYTDWTWAILLGDLDNDGWEDVFAATGMTRNWMDNDLGLQTGKLAPGTLAQFWRSQPVRRDLNLAFKNLGGLQFENSSSAWGLDHPGPSFGAVEADLDGDGRLDLVINDFEAPARVCRNGERQNHRIKLRLQGAHGNRWAIGAKVSLTAGGATQTRYLTLARGFMSATEPLLHFGLGKATLIDRLTVEWPGGGRQEFAQLAADQFYTIQELEKSPAPLAANTPAPAYFLPVPVLNQALHEAETMDDFKRQPLLPWKLSSLGPGMAWGDVDGDGHEELFLSGTTKRGGQIYFRNDAGTFESGAAENTKSLFMEMAPLFFDANGDGSADLYVASGGYLGELGDDHFRHRLWLNNGKGHFTSAPTNVLPRILESGGAVAAADFDRDGDLDLFFGGRLVPGKYPLPPASRLLRNDGGKFSDATESLAPRLARAGMVTSALWTDVDNDGWVDLMATCEWGPVRYYHNEQGKLVEQTETAGLAQRLGLWNSIAAADFNHDGQMDYAVGNLGLNTRYQATPAAPLRLYYGDLAETGEPQLLEAEMTAEGWVPVRGKTAMDMAFPHLQAICPTFHSYAEARVDSLFSTKALESAFQVTVNTLESGVLLNDGKGHFNFQPLPRLAQNAPVFGLAILDANGDGNPDIVMAQNFYAPQPETGHMDGGAGWLMLGKGDGAFEPVAPERSGLLMPGDAKSLTVIDLNEDGWPDLAAGINQDNMLAFSNQRVAGQRPVAVQLRGLAGNPTAAGARVTLAPKNGPKQVVEAAAGGGYLSQSTRTLFWSLPMEAEAALEIRWPDGKTSTHVAGTSTPQIITQP